MLLLRIRIHRLFHFVPLFLCFFLLLGTAVWVITIRGILCCRSGASEMNRE